MLVQILTYYLIHWSWKIY